ncbi:MAG: DUF3443 domain-containing protein [Candidatus Sulfotelmatobacter sp.]
MRLSLPFSWLMGSAALALLAIEFASCGGGSAHTNSMVPPATSGSNVQPVVVNAGPEGNYANGIFTSVTVCVPSTSNCQSINNVLVDTGSYGLRLLSSAGGGALTLSLPQQNASNGDPVGECAAFVTGFTWGPIKTADITISGEKAQNVPVQVVDPTFSAVPQACKNGGISQNDTIQTLGANGILGVGPFAQDCGSQCALIGNSNPGWYYSCSSGSCQTTPVTLTQQVQNPVALFATDNNGVILELPAVSGPAPSLSGSLVFGIGTQSNNSLSGATVFPINSNGNFSTSFKGQSYSAFVDSGSNAYFFLDSNTTGIADCPGGSGFYCPASTANFSAVTSSGSASETISFSIANANTLFSAESDAVFNTLGGPNPGMFDWGLPFFFGRNVYTAIDGRTTPGGVGPYWAY